MTDKPVTLDVIYEEIKRLRKKIKKLKQTIRGIKK